ncbi:unnamed protein product, partial [Notodromas monacha]
VGSRSVRGLRRRPSAFGFRVGTTGEGSSNAIRRLFTGQRRRRMLCSAPDEDPSSGRAFHEEEHQFSVRADSSAFLKAFAWKIGCGGHVQLFHILLRKTSAEQNAKLILFVAVGSYGIVKLAYNLEDDTHYAMKILSKRKLMKRAGLYGRPTPARFLSAQSPSSGGLSLTRSISPGPPEMARSASAADRCPSFVHSGSSGSGSGSERGQHPMDQIRREVAILRKLDHPNVVKLVDVLDDPDDDNLYMGIDVKPSNLLLGEDGRVRVADFGVCNEFSGSDALLTSTAGTPAFLAPEALMLTPRLAGAAGVYGGKAADVWSLGITLYALVFGDVPFRDDSILALYAKIANQELTFPDEPVTSPQLRHLISNMLSKDPLVRITIEEIKVNFLNPRCGESVLHPHHGVVIRVTEEEVRCSVRSIPKLDTLILIKAMLKKHSFRYPFASCNDQKGERRRRIMRRGKGQEIVEEDELEEEEENDDNDDDDDSAAFVSSN